MTSRENIQYCYELAFHPPRLNALWHQIKNGLLLPDEELGAALDTAYLLHHTLPSKGYASQRALTRLALYQAQARAFGMVLFLENLRHHLQRPPLQQTVIPGHLVRDIGLPPFMHHRPASRAPQASTGA